MRWRKVLFLALVAAVPVLLRQVDENLGEFRAQEEVLYLTSGQQVRRLFPGFEGLMSDVYWIRSIQYFGGRRVFAAGKRFDLLEPLINITTELDPKFEIAYRYGAVFLSEPFPMGSGRPEAGVALLERGVRQLPRAWYLQQHLGFFIYFFLKDPARAAKALLEARKQPGSPIWLENMAATFLGEAGEREIARQIWVQMLDTLDEGIFKNNALNNIQRLDALDAVDDLNRVVQTFTSRTGRHPRSLEELRTADLLRAALVDPAGVPFQYDPGVGVVEISQDSPLWRRPLPTARRYEGF